MSVWAALFGGLVGTLVLTTALSAGTQLRLTRMDIPFLLGTVFTDDRSRARLFGYAAHIVNGLVFALIYYVGFVALGRALCQLSLLFPLSHPLPPSPLTSYGSCHPIPREWQRRASPRIRRRCWRRRASCCSTTVAPPRS